jgi:hypothetical protein
METAFALPLWIPVTAAVLGAIFAGFLPTCLYLYVEPRGRRMWARDGDSTATRRAPFLVRTTAWLSFCVGQLAIPWLLVPAVCGGLFYLQLKLPIGRPLLLGATLAVGVAALLQSITALRLIPLGVRLLAHDASTCERLGARARFAGIVNAGALGAAMLLSWAMTTVPNFGHPWLRAALVWTALRPLMAYAAVCLLHAMLLGRCARALCAPKK